VQSFLGSPKMPLKLMTWPKQEATASQPFSGEFPFVKTDGDLYEYACHEGNYGMTNILAGERKLEREGRSRSR